MPQSGIRLAGSVDILSSRRADAASSGRRPGCRKNPSQLVAPGHQHADLRQQDAVDDLGDPGFAWRAPAVHLLVDHQRGSGLGEQTFRLSALWVFPGITDRRYACGSACGRPALAPL
jgi:hypothetical protein